MVTEQPSSPQVRAAVRADAEAIRTIDRLTLRPTVSPADPVDPADGPVDPFARHGPHDVLVAEVAGAVVGYVVLGRPTPLASNAHVRSVQGLAVHPDAQGVGHGRLLVRAAVHEARRRGARRLTLRVLATNTAARALYEQEGFVVEGVMAGEFVLGGNEVDDLLLARRLAPPPATVHDRAPDGE